MTYQIDCPAYRHKNISLSTPMKGNISYFSFNVVIAHWRYSIDAQD